MNEYSIKLVTDYCTWSSLEKDVYEGLSDKSIFSLLNESEFNERIKPPNCIIGLWDGSLLIGYAIYKIPDDIEREEFNIDTEDTVIFDGLAVKKGYRGKGLQLELIKAFESVALNNNCRTIVASVHPNNKYSLSNCLASQYKICDEKDLPYGHRYIIKKNLLGGKK